MHRPGVWNKSHPRWANRRSLPTRPHPSHPTDATSDRASRSKRRVGLRWRRGERLLRGTGGREVRDYERKYIAKKTLHVFCHLVTARLSSPKSPSPCHPSILSRAFHRRAGLGFCGRRCRCGFVRGRRRDDWRIVHRQRGMSKLLAIGQLWPLRSSAPAPLTPRDPTETPGRDPVCPVEYDNAPSRPDNSSIDPAAERD